MDRRAFYIARFFRDDPVIVLDRPDIAGFVLLDDEFVDLSHSGTDRTASSVLMTREWSTSRLTAYFSMPFPIPVVLPREVSCQINGCWSFRVDLRLTG
jgi:hypothetical protein